MEELDLSGVLPDIKKVLLIGHEGTGKTHFIGSMPKPIYMFSFDKGFLTLAGTPGITVGLCMDADRYSPRAYSEFKRKFEELKRGKMYKWPDGREERYATIAIDSLTFLGEFLFDHEQSVNNTIDKPGGFGVWGNVKSRLQDILNQSVMVSEYIVCTALIESSKDDVTGEIFLVPSLPGSMKNEVGAWFDAVFFMVVDKHASTGAKTYKMLTVGDRRQKAKIRIPSYLSGKVSAVEEPSFKSLQDKIKEGVLQQKGGAAAPSVATVDKVSGTIK